MNLTAMIDQSRQVALSLLAPSQRDLDHGLSLHRSSTVCDAFCLGLSAAVDGRLLARAIACGAGRDVVSAMIRDMQVLRWAEPRQAREFAEVLDESGLSMWFQNVESGGSGVDEMRRLLLMRELSAMLPDLVGVEDAPARATMQFSLNHVPMDDEVADVAARLAPIRTFRALGVTMMHLTYDAGNALGGGCRDTVDVGLTDLGREAIHAMNQTGVIVDVAHCGWRTSLEAARASERPVVASHTACADLHPHRRGKPDDVIRAIVDTDGYVGITCVPAFLGGAGDIRAFLDHVDYAIRRYGARHVAIGTDVLFIPPRAVEEAAKFPAPSKLWPAPPGPAPVTPDDPPETPRQLQSMELTNWPLFTVGLVQRGHSDEAIRQVIGGNVLRIANRAGS